MSIPKLLSCSVLFVVVLGLTIIGCSSSTPVSTTTAIRSYNGTASFRPARIL
jgi:hypothetical protein